MPLAMSYPHWGAMAMKPTDFAKALSRYLSDYLPGQRNVSPNTIKSYRETFRLFLRYGKGCGLSIERLCLRQIDEPFIVGFLTWLEHEQKQLYCDTQPTPRLYPRVLPIRPD